MNETERRMKAWIIARRLFGVYDSNGVLNLGLHGPSGLAQLANNYLKKHYDYTNWRVGETKFNDGTSLYWIKSF